MADFDAGDTLAQRFRCHAGNRQHLYGHLMREMADDLEADGVVADICSGYENAPSGAAIQLRILAAVYRLVLQGRAPELVGFYPVLGGNGDPRRAWPAFRRVLVWHSAQIHGALARDPQTNEPGRASALLAGIGRLREMGLPRDIDLLELGASAGLNLLLAFYGFRGPGWRWGNPASPLQLSNSIVGPFNPPNVMIHRARGCDVSPVDVTDAAQALWLRSFVWPFDMVRDERLACALSVAREHPPQVDEASAERWLAQALGGGNTPVVWHSITRQYWPGPVSEAVEGCLADYGARHPCARVWMEHIDGRWLPELGVDWWDGSGGHTSHTIATVHPHGNSVRPIPPFVSG